MEGFLEKRKKQCIDHGLTIMRLIVEEEKAQLTDLEIQIDESTKQLELHKEKTEFIKYNDLLKKGN